MSFGLLEIINNDINDLLFLRAETVVRRRYAGDENLGSELYSMPPASSLPIVTAKQNAWIAKYNSPYSGN